MLERSEFREAGGRPGDERGFFHKKILGAIGKVAGFLPIPGAGLIGTAARALSGGGGGTPTRSGGRPPTFRQLRDQGYSATEARRISRGQGLPLSIPQTFRPTLSFAGATPGGNGRGGPCRPGTIPDPQGRGYCVSPQSPFGQQALGGGGQVVEGRYGPAYVPGSEMRDVAVCPPGFALGKDDLCYEGLANRRRKYPRGRRPLLTGGDMSAISRARRAGVRMANAKSDLISIGMLKPASPRRRKKKSAPCA